MPATTFSEIIAHLPAFKNTVQSTSTHSTSRLLYARVFYHADHNSEPTKVEYLEIDSSPEFLAPVCLAARARKLEDLRPGEKQPRGHVLEAFPAWDSFEAHWPGEPMEFRSPLWLVMLCRLRDEAISPHIEQLQRIPFFADHESEIPNFTKLECERAIDDQLECFRFQRRAFFPSYECWFKWECWSRAGSWLKGKITPKTACKILGLDVAVHQDTMQRTLKACRDAAKTHSAGNEAEWIDAATPLKPHMTPQNALVASVMEPYVTPTLMGGDPDLFIPKDPGCVHAANLSDFDKQLKEPPRAMWWWRSLIPLHKGSDELLDLFLQNWARSAFFYEFRCRINRGKEQPWFGVPWVTLDHVQRAILRAVWPLEVSGPKTIIRPIPPALSEFGKLPRITSQISYDLETTTDGAVLEQMGTMLKKERQKRKIPAFRKGEGRVQTDYRWKILEAMDEAFYMGQTLLPGDRTGKSAIDKQYKAACNAAGIKS